jgi:hypothetical protein
MARSKGITRDEEKIGGHRVLGARASSGNLAWNWVRRVNWNPIWALLHFSFIPKTNLWKCILGTLGDALTALIEKNPADYQQGK